MEMTPSLNIYIIWLILMSITKHWHRNTYMYTSYLMSSKMPLALNVPQLSWTLCYLHVIEVSSQVMQQKLWMWGRLPCLSHSSSSGLFFFSNGKRYSSLRGCGNLLNYHKFMVVICPQSTLADVTAPLMLHTLKRNQKLPSLFQISA